MASRPRDVVFQTVSQLHCCVSESLRRLPFPGRDHSGPLPYVPVRPSVKPIFPVADMARATAFYQALGFEVVAYDDGYAWVKTCGWEILHLRLVAEQTASEASAYFHVDNAVQWHEAISTAGANGVMVSPVVDQPWSMREFELRDPDGNLLRLGQNI